MRLVRPLAYVYYSNQSQFNRLCICDLQYSVLKCLIAFRHIKRGCDSLTQYKLSLVSVTQRPDLFHFFIYRAGKRAVARAHVPQ